MKKVNFITINPLYNNTILNLNKDKIEDFIKEFKEYYSKFDKRLKTTKKKVSVNYVYPHINISIDFNKKHYSQCYNLFGETKITY